MAERATRGNLSFNPLLHGLRVLDTGGNYSEEIRFYSSNALRLFVEVAIPGYVLRLEDYSFSIRQDLENKGYNDAGSVPEDRQNVMGNAPRLKDLRYTTTHTAFTHVASKGNVKEAMWMKGHTGGLDNLVNIGNTIARVVPVEPRQAWRFEGPR